jgi:hypothetical protein
MKTGTPSATPPGAGSPPMGACGHLQLVRTRAKTCPVCKRLASKSEGSWARWAKANKAKLALKDARRSARDQAARRAAIGWIEGLA